MDNNEMITLLSQILDERIGMVTAYAYAKSKGYAGSADDFANDMANIGVNISAIETAINTFNNQTVPNAETAITTAGSNQVNAVNTAGQEQIQNVTAEGGRQVGLVAAAGTAQTEAVNTAGTTQTDAVNTAGSTQVGNVNNAGSQQIAAIQQKGEETRQSIPADYTTLSNDVTDLKSSLNNDLTVEMTNGHFISRITGDAEANGLSSCTGYIPVNKGVTLLFKNIYVSGSRSVYAYDADKNPLRVIVGNSSVTEYTYTVENDVSFIRATAKNAETITVLLVDLTNLIVKNKDDISTNSSSIVELEASVSRKQEALFDWESVGTLVDGLYNKSTGSADLTGSSYRHIIESVTYLQTYQINATAYQNTNYPPIIILDSQNAIIATPYVKTGTGDENLIDYQLTIEWENASKIIINGNINRGIMLEYGTPADLDERFADIDANINEFKFIDNNYGNRIIDEQKKNPFAWGTFDKGCVVFTFDDSLNDIDLVEDISEELGVPVCFSTIPEKLNDTTTATGSNETVYEVLMRAQSAGNEILCHSSTALSDTSTDADVKKVFYTNKMLLENAGFNVNGIIESGSGGGEYTFDTKRGERYLRLYYEYANGYGRNLNLPQFNCTRTYINRDTSVNHGAVNACESSKTLLIFATHSITDTSTSAIDTSEAILRDLMNYCKTKNVYLYTMKTVYDVFRSSVVENTIANL